MSDHSINRFPQLTGTTKGDWGTCRFCLLLLAALAPVCGGCGKTPKGINSEDAACLAALESYKPSHKLDEAGRVIELKLEGNQVNDAALDQVRNLSQLRTLSLYGSSVTDKGLAKLTGLKYLEALGLGATPITDHALTHLEKMPSLHWVWLTQDKQITDQAVENLKKRALPGLTVYR